MPEYPLLDLATQRPGLSHCVYRFLDNAAATLYVGSTGNIWYRVGQHAAERHWWSEVDWGRTVVECVSEAQCPGRSCRLSVHAEMLSYEARLIRDLLPRHNKLSTGYCRSGRHLIAEDAKPDGKGSYVCGACVREWHRQHYLANREERLAAASAHYEANRDKVTEYRKRPDVQARARARMKEYKDKPENRARANDLARRRRAERKKPVRGKGGE